MKAAFVTNINKKWEIKDIPVPKPGINQVLIKIHASGICYTDVHQTEGHLPGIFPRILGHEPKENNSSADKVQICRTNRCRCD